MAAPSLVIQQLASSTATSIPSAGTATRASTSVTVATGDLLAFHFRSEDGAYHGTAVASSGTAVTSAWTLARTTGTANATCANDLFTASVTTGGTLVATVTINNTSGAVRTPRQGATLVVATGATASATALSASARQLSYLTTSPASAVFTFTTDWTAAASNGATFVPSTFGQVIDVRATDGVDQQSTAGANSSVFNAHWTDTGTAATTTYGLSSPSAGTYNTTLVEFLGTAGGAATRDNKLMAPIRRY